MAGRKSVARPTRKKKAPANGPTLADVVICWTAPDGAPVRVPGVAIARLALYHSHRHGLAGSLGLDVFGDELRALPMARGLSGVLFPDAGSPQAEQHADERFFVSEALGDLAAALETERAFSHDVVRSMTVEITPGAGLATVKRGPR